MQLGFRVALLRPFLHGNLKVQGTGVGVILVERALYRSFCDFLFVLRDSLVCGGSLSSNSTTAGSKESPCNPIFCRLPARSTRRVSGIELMPYFRTSGLSQ